MNPLNPRTPLDPRLSLADAIEAAQHLWARHDLESETNATKHLNALAHLCLREGVHDLDDLASRAVGLITQGGDASMLTTFHDRKAAVRMSEMSNTIRALLLSAGMYRAEDPRQLIERLPVVRGRSLNKGRALEGDEILLLRLEALLRALKGGRAVRFALQYALVETGATTSEIKDVTLGAFDDYRAPTSVELTGHGNAVGPRTALLAPWARSVMMIALAEHVRQRGDALDVPVAYLRERHTKKQNNPAAAVCTNLARAMAELGLGKGKYRPQPHGILRWRVHQVLTNQGTRAAATLVGRSNSNSAVYTFVGLQPPQISAIHHPKRVKTMLGQ